MNKLSKEKQKELIEDLEDWKLEDNPDRIVKEMEFDNFKESMEFVNRLAELAEEKGHHPDIYISYNIVILEIMTHDIGGLTEDDFSLAKEINKL